MDNPDTALPHASHRSSSIIMEDSIVLSAIDRTLTDLLPDKHQYEADPQLYLDYSLPPHPEVVGMEEKYADDLASPGTILAEDIPATERDTGQDWDAGEHSPDPSTENLPADTKRPLISSSESTDLWPQATQAPSPEAEESTEDTAAADGTQDDESTHEEYDMSWPAADPGVASEGDAAEAAAEQDWTADDVGYGKDNSRSVDDAVIQQYPKEMQSLRDMEQAASSGQGIDASLQSERQNAVDPYTESELCIRPDLSNQ